ncbi:MAG: transglycosylase SLT domain-containing protein [Euryarchaeota archaeon]|nr:transglycosylase SLT domain-containing protein [Euryarchaeota archaeon]
MKFLGWLLTIFILLTGTLSASYLAQKYPSYRYVMRQFDVNASYIDNPQFVEFVRKNEAKYRRFYTNSLKRGKDYIPTFTELLLSNGLSHLFIYLSMTESGFKTYAKSQKKAAGLWQFMSATARNYHLIVNQKVDQRYDPVASTQAAMRYINALYKKFGKWYLVMMAYNCGEGRLTRAIKRAGTDDFEVLMDARRRLIPPETRDYLKKIILLAMMGERIVESSRPEDKKIKRKIIDGKTFVNVVAGTRIIDLVNILDMSLPDFMDMNPHITTSRIPADAFLVQIAIPAEKFQLFKDHYQPPTLKEIYKEKHYSRLVAHVVRKGENLKTIAQHYKVAPIELIIANELPRAKLSPGQVVMVPVTEDDFQRHKSY